MNKQQIIECTDGQALADAVAVEVMGWLDNDDYWMEPFQVSEDDVDFQPIIKSSWQPHLPTEKGKAQCWDLVIKSGLRLQWTKDVCSGWVQWFDLADDGHTVYDRNPQIAVLKAALLTVKE